MWNTLRAESGGRWCQPHPCSMELLTIGELMRNMERRAADAVEAKSDAITLCKEMSVFRGPQALHEWFVANKARINAVIA